jgi:hypothetical protein
MFLGIEKDRRNIKPVNQKKAHNEAYADYIKTFTQKIKVCIKIALYFPYFALGKDNTNSIFVTDVL